MIINKIYALYFSPNGTTKEIVTSLAKNIGENIETINLTIKDIRDQHRTFGPDELVVIGFPVYADRIPAISKGILDCLEGTNTPVIAVVSYGNRDYGDALLELTSELEKINMTVIAGLTTIGEHCLNTEIATNRPDKKDHEILKTCGQEISDKIKNISNIAQVESLNIKGNHPYAPLKSSVIPTGDSKCVQCGLCYKECPVKAIDPENFKITDPKLCISCGHCIQICPTGARDVNAEYFVTFMKKLKEMTKDRKEIEMFL